MNIIKVALSHFCCRTTVQSDSLMNKTEQNIEEVPSMDDPVGPKIFTSIHTTVLNKQFIIMSSGTAVRRNSDKFRTVNVY